MVIETIRSKFVVGNGGRRIVRGHAEIASQSVAVAKEFDPSFYAARYPEVRGDPLQHFMNRGWKEGKDPAPWFSTSFYVDTYKDVAEAGLNPFYHYIEHGRAEGRPITSANAEPSDRSWEVEAIRSGIDEAFYADQLRRVDVDPSGLDLALHYWREGAKLGFDPAKNFSTTHYLADHPDVAAVGVNPFTHYLLEGRKEGRNARPTEPHKTAGAVSAARVSRKQSGKDHDRALVAGGFDAKYYLSANPDVAAAGVDPLDHFLGSGWREGRNPNLWFSVTHYLDFYPDIAAAGINPFLHYLMVGKSEGRLPRHDLGFRYDIITSLQPLEERIEFARKSAPRRQASGADKLRAALGSACQFETKGVYLSISHDDFTENFGGVQLVLMREAAAVGRMGYDHIHLFPATPLQVTELEVNDPVVGVLLNGKRIGFFRAEAIARELGVVASRVKSRPFVIHSLIGHNADAIAKVLKALGCETGWYWVHDYSSVCTGYTLLRNDVEFCGGPPPTSTACSICVYGRLRRAQMDAHELLFKEFDLTVLAPSEAALDVWKASASVIAPARVHEHLKLKAPSKGKSTRAGAIPDRPVRVAYIGQPVTHKGWPVFRELALQFGRDPRYQFYHVGKGPQGVPGTFAEVAVGADDLDKMTRTLRELEIDIAILWSLWPETFCIAAAEALTAGAAVLTFKDSGNAAAMVRKTGFGAVLESEDELMKLFESGAVIQLAAKKRPTGLTATFSNMTADFVEGVTA